MNWFGTLHVNFTFLYLSLSLFLCANRIPPNAFGFPFNFIIFIYLLAPRRLSPSAASVTADEPKTPNNPPQNPDDEIGKSDQMFFI